MSCQYSSELPVNTVRTVSDTKRAFYRAHTHPINSIYRRVVDELMVEMHLLTVNQHYIYSPIYALGVVTTFDRFMQGYRPEADVASIFSALCAAVDGSASQYRQDAEQLKSSLAGVSWAQLAELAAPGAVGAALKAVNQAPHFKYTRLFAIGLYTLLEQIDPDASQDQTQRLAVLEQLAKRLNLSGDRLEKDLEIYRGNLDKMAQAQQAIADTIAAERKRREQRELDKVAAASGSTAPGETLKATDEADPAS
jgi:photosystem II biogenesis protein Psp29